MYQNRLFKNRTSIMQARPPRLIKGIACLCAHYCLNQYK